MGIPIFTHNDIEINYIMKGKGKPLVLVHGFGTKYQGWNFQISYFEKKMKVIALVSSNKSISLDYDNFNLKFNLGITKMYDDNKLIIVGGVYWCYIGNLAPFSLLKVFILAQRYSLFF